MYRLELTIHILPKAISPNARVHWAVRYKESAQIKQLVKFQATTKGLPQSPLTSAKIKYTRHSSKCPDFDNLVSSFKAVQDGLKECGVIIDDNQTVLKMKPEYLWEFAPANKGKIVVVVESV